MKLASIRQAEKTLLALQFEEQLLDLAALAAALNIELPESNLNDLITDVIEQPAMLGALYKLTDKLETCDRDILEEVVIRGEFDWLPPVRRPGKILGVAMNNNASDARKIKAPSHPAFFLKPSTCLIGHEQPIEVRDYYGSVHPEPELAMIIGKRVKDISADDAWDAIFGYTVFNDITGNDMRADDSFHYWALYPTAADPHELERRESHVSYAARYKGSDGFGPMGPWVVTADEIPDPHALSVRCWHKDELVADDNTQYMNYKANEVIAYISRFQTLEPGDVISLGTAFRQKEGQKRSLHMANITRFGGPLRVEIEGIGTLENPVIQK